jgi:hypothetical protein
VLKTKLCNVKQSPKVDDKKCDAVFQSEKIARKYKNDGLLYLPK